LGECHRQLTSKNGINLIRKNSNQQWYSKWGQVKTDKQTSPRLSATPLPQERGTIRYLRLIYDQENRLSSVFKRNRVVYKPAAVRGLTGGREEGILR
jgi:hypothetical protein